MKLDVVLHRCVPLVLGLAVALVGAAGCDAFVTGEYRGDPLLTLEGNILVAEEARLVGDVPLRVSMFWVAADLGELDDLEVVGEQTVGARAAQPARYTLDIYHPPTQRALTMTKDGEMAIAVILVYEDVNGNGRRESATERVLGGSGEYAVLFAPTGLGAGAFGESLGAGYHVMEVGGGGECDDDDEVITMQPAGEDRWVDLLIDSEGSVLLPDIDCDGRHEFDDDDDDGDNNGGENNGGENNGDEGDEENDNERPRD